MGEPINRKLGLCGLGALGALAVEKLVPVESDVLRYLLAAGAFTALYYADRRGPPLWAWFSTLRGRYKCFALLLSFALIVLLIYVLRPERRQPGDASAIKQDVYNELYGAVRGEGIFGSGLVSIDTSTGNVSEVIGGLSGYQVRDMAWCGGELMGVGKLAGKGTTYLLRIDRITGDADPISDLGPQIFRGLACEGEQDHMLALTGDGYLFAVSPGSGRGREIWQFPHGASNRSLAMRDERSMFLGTEGAGTEGQDLNGLHLVDMYDHGVEFMGTYKAERPADMFNNVGALAYDKPRNLLMGISAGEDEYLIEIDQLNGRASVIAKLSNNHRIIAIAFAPRR